MQRGSRGSRGFAAVNTKNETNVPQLYVKPITQHPVLCAGGCSRTNGSRSPPLSARRGLPGWLQPASSSFGMGMHSVPKSAVLPYGSGVGGLSRRLLNRATPYVAAAGHSPSSAMGQTAVPPTPLHRTSVSPQALSGTLSFRRHVFAGNPHHRRGFPVRQAAPPKSIMSTVLPNTPFPKSKERMLGCWGGT